MDDLKSRKKEITGKFQTKQKIKKNKVFERKTGRKKKRKKRENKVFGRQKVFFLRKKEKLVDLKEIIREE